MTRPSILMPKRMADVVIEGCQARFDLIPLWEAGDAEGVLAPRAEAIRGIASVTSAKIDADLIGRLPNLEIVANFGVGYDNVDTEAAARRGVMVTNTPDVLNEEVADTAFGLMLMTVRELPQAERYLRAGKWKQAPYPLTRGSLRAATLGIVGLGRIGRTIARRAEAFGMQVAYHGRREQPDQPYRYYADLKDMARAVDILLLIAPGGPETYRMVDAGMLEALGPDGILINMARGSLVDEAALIEALRAGTIHAAGLDVYESEPTVPDALIACENAVLLPHVGSASMHTRRAMGQLVVDNLAAWFDTGKPLTPVPETPVTTG